MSIQLINLYKVNDGDFSVNEISNFSSPKSFDMFDINIIDLRSREIYRNKNSMEVIGIDCISDFVTINEMIANSKKAKFIFIYPKNIDFLALYEVGRYRISNPIKDITSYVSKVFGVLNIKLDYKFSFERTDTKLSDDVNISADFYFPERDDFDILLRSIDSNKVTCCKKDNLFLTTLDILTDEELQLFLEKIGLKATSNTVAPDWMSKVMLFDDAEQLKNIEENEVKIKSSQESIAGSKDKLSENSWFKSILYTSGDELVDVVKDIFSKIFDVDFSEFKDKKNKTIDELQKNTSEIESIVELINISKTLLKHFDEFMNLVSIEEILTNFNVSIMKTYEF